jgi:phosphatidate cytidylyltransferase
MAPLPADTIPAVSPHPLRRRVLSAVVLAPLALLVVWGGGLVFDLWIAVAAALMAWEWSHVTAAGRLGTAGLALAVGAVGAVGVASLGGAVWYALPVVLVGAVVVYGLARGDGVEAPGWLAAGMLAIGIPCIAFIWLREHALSGRSVVFWLLAVVWATDIGAYGFGRWLGGPRLAPRISPNKTWAGLLGGVASAALISALAAWLLDGAGLVPAALAGGAVAVIAQAGDLGESLVKRRFGVKDAGALIPGHGGLLDRVDGLLAAAPAVALLIGLEGVSGVGWS